MVYIDNMINISLLRLEINEFLDIVKDVLWEETFKKAKGSLEVLCSVYLFPSNFNSNVITHFNNIQSIIFRLSNIYELEMFFYSIYLHGKELVKFLAAIEKEIQ